MPRLPSLARLGQLAIRHASFVGPGLVSSVAYIDPGNWATDLSAGASYGYKLLFIVLLAGLAAVVLQLLSVRLGAVSSRNLAANTRLLFLRLIERHPKWRLPLKASLYGLYALAEIAIIGTDLAELIGTAIALNLLFPRLPLWAGVLITASDVLIILIFFRTSNGRKGMLFFEMVIVSLVLAVFISFTVLLHLIKPDWREVFIGLVPSHTLVESGALYVGVGIVGATVMPHALFLGSELASVDRLNMAPRPPMPQSSPRSFKMPNVAFAGLRRRHRADKNRSPEVGAGTEMDVFDSTPGHLDLPGPSSRPPTSAAISRISSVEEYSEEEKEYQQKVKRFDRIRWVDVHLLHAAIDTTMSLLGFALTINAAILTLAGAAFFYGTTGATADDADLQGAYHLIHDLVGRGPAILFALALLCAGQSASITATLAGQVVSEGFLEWKTSPLVRRLVTRCIGVVPAAAVSAAVGAKGLNTMLVASQVLLSIVLPTVIFPLVYLCSKEDVMTVLGPEIESEPHLAMPDSPTRAPSVRRGPLVAEGKPGSGESDLPIDGAASFSATGQLQASPEEAFESAAAEPRRKKSYRSPLWLTILGHILFALIIIANVYVIVELILGA